MFGKRSKSPNYDRSSSQGGSYTTPDSRLHTEDGIMAYTALTESQRVDNVRVLRDPRDGSDRKIVNDDWSIVGYGRRRNTLDAAEDGYQDVLHLQRLTNPTTYPDGRVEHPTKYMTVEQLQAMQDENQGRESIAHQLGWEIEVIDRDRANALGAVASKAANLR